ncbi:hypothetical protein EDD86DRAFT_196296, partial [Gorgonomyces haynaldii]
MDFLSEHILEIGTLLIAGSLGYWLLSTKKQQEGPNGLYNPGNSCFMNSVVQAISSLDHFKDYLRKSDGPMTKQTLELIESLEKMDGRTINPKDFVYELIRQGGGQHLMGYHQQDAQELFQVLSDILSKETASPYHSSVGSLFSLDDLYLKQEQTLDILFYGKHTNHLVFDKLRNPFTGLIGSTITCLTCGYQTPVRLDCFDNLSIVVPQQNRCTLESMLEAYCTNEIIHDYICDKCSTKQTLEHLIRTQAKKGDIAFVKDILRNHSFDTPFPPDIKRIKSPSVVTKQTLLVGPPKCLVLHMQRSIFLPNGYSAKNHCAVEFPQTLNLTRLFSKPMPTPWKQTPPETNVVPSVEQNINEPPPLESVSPVSEEQTLEMLLNEYRNPNLIYQLTAAVLHFGSHDSGHFITIKRIGNTWYNISDENVRKTSVFALDNAGAQVYMLFYETRS